MEAENAKDVPATEAWTLCNEGECKCLVVSSKTTDSPVCKVYSGKWGDDYPALRIVGDSLQQRAEPYMEQITYGEIPHEDAVRCARIIAAAPEMLFVLRYVQAWSGERTIRDLASAVIAKADGHA